METIVIDSRKPVTALDEVFADLFGKHRKSRVLYTALRADGTAVTLVRNRHGWGIKDGSRFSGYWRTMPRLKEELASRGFVSVQRELF